MYSQMNTKNLTEEQFKILFGQNMMIEPDKEFIEEKLPGNLKFKKMVKKVIYFIIFFFRLKN